MNVAKRTIGALTLGFFFIAGCGGPVEGEDLTHSEAALGTGTGLTATYFSDATLGVEVARQVDAQIDFNWDLGAPAQVPSPDGFSVRWTGQVEAAVSGTHVFTTTSDDGVRLWVNGQLLVDNWTRHAAIANSGSISLNAGSRYSIKMEFFEQTGRAVAKLAWTPPGRASQIIPQSALYPTAPVATGGVSVSGNHLTRNGQLWIPKGLSMIGSLTCGSARTAFSHWGPAEVAAAKAFGADTFRFQVSQPFLDPQGAQYSAPYLQRLKDMVALAENSGFAVILSMQDQSLACGNADPMPTASTQRAWNALAPVFARDPLVIYELYNEPQNYPDAAGWAQWKNGANGTVGHQTLLNLVRSLGSQNVVLADGARLGEILTGLPLLNDPLGKVGYATHPYYMASINSDPLAWDKRFGNLSATVPVVATEWNANSGQGGCTSNDDVLAARLVTYLKAHNIGVYGWAYDLPGTLVLDWSWAPTNFNNFVCGTGSNGAGQLLKTSYLQ